ncbi:hypothetical protein Gotri_013309 [Gossypium trilobum]|uniref:Leucine-rich repeat-containing N-terminal plant-type domain-containing protein n=1 Tax=Gossypium trilobum TaxID=34281 RepID=A0A7J9DT66_9ROSI|nr:hypothetical protein [Gossypium trilobum]
MGKQGRKRLVSYALFLAALFQCRFLAFAILDPLDFLALQLIRKSMNDLPGSSFFASWDFTSDPCNFTGVYCESDKLTNVLLCHNNLSGSVPPFLSQALTRLDLKRNALTGSLPNSFSPSLQFLSLSWNQLTGPVDSVVSRLDQLSFLDLSFNRFTGPIPDRIFSFPLTNLHLQRNSFYGPVQPGDQVKISTVDLSHNMLSGRISPMFSTVQNLYLNHNRFTGQVPDSLVDRLLSASLQTLYLQHNFLTGIGINPTAEIPQSTSLCIQYNCMVPPVQTPCPLKFETQKTRPTSLCNEWKG